MKTHPVLPLLTVSILSVLAAGNAQAGSDGKVTICHKDKVEINVDRSALKAHLGHGDVEGECPPPPAPVETGADSGDGDGDSEDGAGDPGVEVGVEIEVDVSVEGEAPLPPAVELCKAPVESETTVKLADGSAYNVALLSQNGPTWTYQVDHAAGKDLSHWALGLEACFDHIVEADAGADIGTDGSTGFVGVKWDSEGGVFSLTLDADYPATLVEVLAKAGTQSATALVAGPDCAAEAAPDTVADAAASSPPEPTVIPLNDDKDSQYSVSLLSREDTTWTYQVDGLAGRDLSHWSLGLGSCLEHIAASSEGAETGTDGSTGFVGVKWNGKGGTFSITLDGDYPEASLDALVKAGTESATGKVPGPDCSAGTVEELPVCSDPQQLAAVPLGQVLLLDSAVAAWEELSQLEPETLLAQLQTAGYARGFMFQDKLFLPNMQVPGMQLSFAGFTLKFNFSLLFQREENEGLVTFNVVAVALEPGRVSQSKVTGDYTLDDMVLSVPVVDVVEVTEATETAASSVNINAFSLHLTLVNFEPMSFQAVLNQPLWVEAEADDGGDDD